LGDETRSYRYALDITEILVFGDVAVVRLVWTLTIKEKDGREMKSVEPGMDLFRRQADGSWKIVRYMAYEE
jgi:ketosteroid isomerase-like protein